jgi:DNA end-binding protein Ku
VAEHDEDDVAPRSFWSGTITFGLVSIPVELYPAHRSQRVSLRMVAPDGTPLARRYFCPKEGKALEWDEIVRGYELEKDEYVVVTDEELEKLAPDRTRDIDLRRFVPAADLDPMHFQRAYFLTPGGNSNKAYRLLAATMEQTGRAGIATFVMRGKEYLVAILAENGILRAETLRFADEVRTTEDVGLPEPAKPATTSVRRMEKAIAALARSTLDEDQLEDTAAQRLLELAARKERAGEDVVQAPDGAATEPTAGVIDLMEVLKRSLQGDAGGTRDARDGRDARDERDGRDGRDGPDGRDTGGAARKTVGGRKSPAGRGSRASRDAAAAKGRAASTGSGKRRAAKSAARGDGGRKGRAAGGPTKADLARRTKDELYEQAKRLDIPGRSGMTKDELIAAIRRLA